MSHVTLMNRYMMTCCTHGEFPEIAHDFAIDYVIAQSCRTSDSLRKNIIAPYHAQNQNVFLDVIIEQGRGQKS